MEEVLNKILDRLEKLDKIELDLAAVKNRVEQIDKRVEQIDKKVDVITEVVAQTIESVTELKDKVEKQEVEIKVIKGGKAQ